MSEMPLPPIESAPTALAAALLEEYQDGTSSFFFASPGGTLLTRGVWALLPDAVGPDLPERAAALLEQVRSGGFTNPLLVGAIPFDSTQPGSLFVPALASHAGPMQLGDVDGTDSVLPAAGQIRAVPPDDDYCRGVADAVARIEAGDFDKVVLARSLEVQLPAGLDLRGLLRRLAGRNPSGYTFAVPLPGQSAFRGRRTFIGASPELLVRKSGLRVVANPLAGSAPRSADPVEDKRRAAVLRASDKNRREHALVVDAVAAALKPFCRSLDVPAAPSLVSTPTLWHLSTTVEGELHGEAACALTLALALHPTPAICGYPADSARAVIGEIEPFERGYFTGMVGWRDARGDGEWAVSIRCAEVENRLLRLYAGAGIVAGSRPEAELAETAVKFRTLLDAIGFQRPGEVAAW